jgi:hypothetical protein
MQLVLMLLNKTQQRVYEWLNDDLGLPVFAEAYRGAAIFIDQKPAGYISFVAHAGRDLMNGLAAAIHGIKRKQVQYVQLVNSFQEDWLDEWRSDNELLTNADIAGHLIPADVCKKISTLIDEHKSGRERSTETDGLFFSTFLDYSDRDKIPGNFLAEWKSAKNWFLVHAHLRETPFHAETDNDLVKYFNCLDGYLYIAASSQYDRLKDLNEALDATNQ